MITGVILGTAALGLIVSLFGDRYECSPEEVQEACEELSNISNNTLQAISDEIGKEVGIVNNAASGLLDISNMNEYAPAVQDSITNLISVLDKQAEMIEEYNNGNLVEKMLGTGTMAILNLTEGIARFGEDIVDAGANIIAGFGSIFGADTESIELWAAKDHVGNWFDDAFENGAFNWVEKYSIYSHESTAAEIFKGIGTAIPYIALAATGVGLAAEATVAGAAGFGRGSTNYQQQHLEYDANGVASFDDTYSTGSMMWEGTKQGVVDAALTVGMDVGFKAIGNGISKLRAGKGIGKVAETATQNADEVTKALTTTSDDAARAVVNGTDDTGKALLKNVDGTAKNVINGVDDAGKAALKNVDGAAKNVINGVDDAGNAALKNVDGATKNVINGVDDAGKAALKNVDGTAKNVINGVDDAGRAVANSADDAGRALINSADDAGRAVANSTDDVGRTVVNGADDAMEATVKGSDSATLSQAKQDLLKRYQSGEITRDEMLDGVRRAANPEEALKADKAQLLNDFRSGKITRDEMIQGIQKNAGNAPAKAVVNSADDAGKAALKNVDGTAKNVINGVDDTGKALINSTDNVANATTNAVRKTDYELTEELSNIRKAVREGKMTPAEGDAAAKIVKRQLKEVHPDVLAGQARKAATETAEQTARKAATETAEQTARKAASGTAEQAASKATQSGSKWNSPLEATTTRAKIARAYDNVATTAKKVVTDTITFAKEKPAETLVGGGLLSAEKAIGNIKSSHIPTNYASAEVQELSKVGGGENRIVIDEVDDLIAQTGTDTPTTPEPTQPSQTYTGGTSTGGGTYTAPTTPSSNNNTTTTPSEKPNDGSTTTPGTNDNNNNNNDNNNDNQDNNKSDDSNKTPDNNTPATPEPTPGDNVNTEVSNPPSNNNQGSSGTNHGGTTNNNTGNSSTGNNNWNSNTTTESGIEEKPELEPELPIEDSDLIDEPNEEESVYTIPSNLSGVKQTKKTSSGSSVLPVLGGLGAAAAVGVGAKMYLDNKKNNENGDDDEEYSEGDDENFNTSENDDLLADEWNGEDTEFNYEDSSGDNSVETDDDDLGEM